MATALSTKQSAFISALASITTASPVKRADLVAAATKCGMACPPAWIVKDSTRSAGRGLFHVPEVNGTSMPASSPSTVAAQPSAPVMVQAVRGAAAPVQSVDTTRVLGMTGGDRTTLVPDKIDTYVPWGHFSSIESIVKSTLFSPMFITGLSGNGKTTMVEQVCAKLKRECFRVNITAETDESDLLGSFGLVDGNTVWQDGPVTLALKRGAILLLDEIDLGTEKIMSLQSVLEGKGVMIKKIGQFVHPAPGFNVVATANTKGKGDDNGRFAGTRILNEAFLDRFDFTYEQAYAPKATERKILIKKMGKFGKVDEEFADNLVRWAEIIRSSFDDNAIDEIITTRRLEGVCKAYAIFGDRMEAIKMCVSRFDELTRQGMLDAYTKIDAQVQPVDSSQTAEEAQGPQPYDASKAYTSDVINNAKTLWLMTAKYEDRNTVKAAGALWDPAVKKWCILPNNFWSNPTMWNQFEPRPVDNNNRIIDVLTV
jgi:MoxR-like ATPase